MTTSAIKHVNIKLKNLPDTLVEEVEKYIDFLAFKYSQESQDVPQWHKDVVLQRIESQESPVDAFKMIEELEG
ncbi:hypothetical protein FBBAL38_08929 [Flavobacteria bacterium BAL38]|nr:hypothetical protein FBBAL38_08929 [Flavobacteria bacterium BAL38]